MTARRIIKKPRVEKDLAYHFSTIARDKIAPAERFLHVAEQSFERLVEMPGIGRHSGLSNAGTLSELFDLLQGR